MALSVGIENTILELDGLQWFISVQNLDLPCKTESCVYFGVVTALKVMKFKCSIISISACVDVPKEIITLVIFIGIITHFFCQTCTLAEFNLFFLLFFQMNKRSLILTGFVLFTLLLLVNTYSHVNDQRLFQNLN